MQAVMLEQGFYQMKIANQLHTLVPMHHNVLYPLGKARLPSPPCAYHTLAPQP